MMLKSWSSDLKKKDWTNCYNPPPMAIQMGCDLVHVPRIRAMIADRPGTLEKLFTPEELNDQRPEHLAGLFAAKEATMKALGFEAGRWLELKVSKRPNGAPVMELSENLAKNVKEIQVSISHDGEYAMACVVATTK